MVAQKRRSEAAEETSKRARAGSSSAPSTSKAAVAAKPIVQIPFGVNPSPHVEILSQPLCGSPLYLWVNPEAATLFAQIESVRSLVYSDGPDASRIWMPTKSPSSSFGSPFLPINGASTRQLAQESWRNSVP